ncbi:MAG: DUF3107 family protein [Acidobacteria bacterium]|jgi:hypothetical protein|nr:DUF3107 family protein [Acidobacteriota bacterium]
MSSKKSEKASKVRISITNVGSELSFQCSSSPAEIKAAVTAALTSAAPLVLQDVVGNEIIVPADKIGYVEIGEPAERRVGFGVA